MVGCDCVADCGDGDVRGWAGCGKADKLVGGGESGKGVGEEGGCGGEGGLSQLSPDILFRFDRQNDKDTRGDPFISRFLDAGIQGSNG